MPASAVPICISGHVSSSKLRRSARGCMPQVKYREDGAVDQFLSDVSVLGPRGVELTRKSISVNDPLRFRVRLAR